MPCESDLFAGDTTLLATGKDIDALLRKVNIEFQIIVEYFRANKMLLHPSKTKFMIFNAPRVAPLVAIQINNNNAGMPTSELLISNIEQVSKHSDVKTIKFLGINLDNDLSFE